MQPLTLKIPLKEEEIKKLRLGQLVYLSGTIFTARDKAHQRILNFIKESKQLPANLEKGVIFHAGPIAKKNKKWKIFAIGPTTSSRMNPFTGKILSKFHLSAIIGKGGIPSKIFQNRNTVYLTPTGGCSALLTQKIKKVQGVHWLDLSPAEAVWELEVEKFGPLIVAIDSQGNSLYAKIKAKVNENLERKNEF